MTRTYRRLSAYAFVVLSLTVWILGLAPDANPADQDNHHDPFIEARILINSGRYLEALSHYQTIYDTASQSDTAAKALFFIGSVYNDYLDQPDRALACFDDIARLHPNSRAAPDALFNSGSIFYKNDRYAEAQKAFQTYVHRYPNGMRRQSAMAWADSSAKRLHRTPNRTEPAPTPTLSVLSPDLRVLLIKNQDRLTFTGSQDLIVRDSQSGRILMSGRSPLVFSLKDGRMRVNNRPVGVPSCLVSSGGETLGLEDKRFRGQIQVLATAAGLMAVNALSVEDYLYGVVPREMSWLWAPEALMAQSIASRTYALYIRDRQRLAASDYDLEATTSSQVYGGFDSEKDQTRQAVDRTRGRVLTFQGKLIIAYFHANSGGRTESALNVWGVDIPYLRGVADAFSTILPDTVWEHRVTLKEVTALFRPITPGLGPIRGIEAGATSPSGRILSFKLVSATGHKTLPGNLFRMTLGPTKLKSTRLDIRPQKDTIIFRGSGYGHGVGMSQWGAHRMAQAGYSVEAILKHYYTGVSIMQVDYL